EDELGRADHAEHGAGRGDRRRQRSPLVEVEPHRHRDDLEAGAGAVAAKGGAHAALEGARGDLTPGPQEPQPLPGPGRREGTPGDRGRRADRRRGGEEVPSAPRHRAPRGCWFSQATSAPRSAPEMLSSGKAGIPRSPWRTTTSTYPS